MSRSIQCRHCQAVWEPSEVVRAGKKVQCPECRRDFAPEATTAMKTAPPPPSGRSRYGDDDDDDAFAPRIRKRRRPQKSYMLLWLFLVGGLGFGALLVCVGSGIGAYFLLRSSPRLTGQWELTDPPMNGARILITFRRDGTGLIDGPAADVHFTYTFKKDDPMTLEWRITQIDNKQRIPVAPVGGLGMRPMPRFPMFANNNQHLVGVVERFRVDLKDDTLKLTAQNDGSVLTLRRMK
jgi:hypothetical protein